MLREVFAFRWHGYSSLAFAASVWDGIQWTTTDSAAHLGADVKALVMDGEDAFSQVADVFVSGH